MIIKISAYFSLFTVPVNQNDLCLLVTLVGRVHRYALTIFKSESTLPLLEAVEEAREDCIIVVDDLSLAQGTIVAELADILEFSLFVVVLPFSLSFTILELSLICVFLSLIPTFPFHFVVLKLTSIALI